MSQRDAYRELLLQRALLLLQSLGLRSLEGCHLC